jgi:hypothetical protein
MTPTEINREMAEKVMGWHLDGISYTQYWYDDSGIKQLPFDGWDHFDPYHRWDHAAMGLERLCKGKNLNADIVIGFRGECFCHPMEEMAGYNQGPRILYGPKADTAPAAICLACIKAEKETRPMS